MLSPSTETRMGLPIAPTSGTAERLFVRLDHDPLYAPETRVPRGALGDLPVAPPLQPWVAHAISYREELAPSERANARVLPHGAVHLILELNESSAVLQVAGPRLGPVLLDLQGSVRKLVLNLRPGAAPALLGVSAHELADRFVPWEALVPARERDLAAQLHQAGSDGRRMLVLAAALQRLRRDGDTTAQRKTQHAVEQLRAGGRCSLDAAARSIGVSQRRLEQLFRAQLGLTPRAWRRLARLHDCLRVLRGGEAISWAAMAADCGFSDQPHMVREFRALCGLTPTQLAPGPPAGHRA